MATRLEKFIENDEEFKFEEGVSHPELSMYEVVTDDDIEYCITLDDDDLVYCVWSVSSEDDVFIPLDTDMYQYGTTYSMYYCQERKEWVQL